MLASRAFCSHLPAVLPAAPRRVPSSAGAASPSRLALAAGAMSCWRRSAETAARMQSRQSVSRWKHRSYNRDKNAYVALVTGQKATLGAASLRRACSPPAELSETPAPPSPRCCAAEECIACGYRRRACAAPAGLITMPCTNFRGSARGAGVGTAPRAAIGPCGGRVRSGLQRAVRGGIASLHCTLVKASE